MAKTFISASIATGLTIEAGHVTQSADALTGTEAYDITISGSLEITGSTNINGVLSIPGFSNVSASLATSFDGFPFTGSAGLLGTLDVNGPAGHITASGNISASGNLEGGGLKIDGAEVFDNPSILKLQSGSSVTDTAAVLRTSNERLLINSAGDFDTIEALNAGLIATSITASGNISASGDLEGGGLNVIGVSRMSSSNSPSIVSVLTENDNHPFIIGATTTGPNFRMNLADANASGSAYMALGRQTGAFGGTGFTAHYATGSNASQGEIVMTLGKNGPIGQIFDRFIVQSEPGPIASNTVSELTLAVGSSTQNRRVVQGIFQNAAGDYAEFVAGNQDATPGFKKHVLMQFGFNNTSSIAGFSSSSLNTGSTARNFNSSNVPFGVVAGTSDSDTAFFIDKGFLGQSTPVTASFQISREGSIDMEGSITASGNISSSDTVFGITGSFSQISSNPNSSQKTDIKIGSSTIEIGPSAADTQLGGTSFPFVTNAGANNFKGMIAASNYLVGSGSSGLGGIPTTSTLRIGGPATLGDPFTVSVSVNGQITASGDISSSGQIIGDSFRVQQQLGGGGDTGLIISGSTFDGDNRDAQIIYPNHGLHFNDNSGNNNHVLALQGNTVGIRREPEGGGDALQVSGSIVVIDGHITASGHGVFQAGKPIITHTSSPISSSLANAGRYHIVGGNLTASIVLDTNASVGAEFEFFQTSSTGQFLFESASGTTVISKNGSMRLAQQGSSAVLKKVSTTTFHLMGDLT